MIDWEKLFIDSGLDYKVRESGRYRLLVYHCPLCVSSTGSKTPTGAFFMGSENNMQATCFRCGTHSGVEVISVLLDTPISNAKTLISSYSTEVVSNPTVNIAHPTVIDLSFANRGLDSAYSEYLIKRGLNPKKVTEYADLRYTNHIGELYSRIVFPIYYKGKIVSYTSRTIIDNPQVRYISCSNNKEVMNHKDICYGCDKLQSSTVLVVESPVNSIKIGNDICVATFGIAYSEAQVNFLKQFKKVIISFDSEVKAQIQAEKLAKAIGLFTDVSVVDLEFSEGKDLGDCSRDELITIRKELGFSAIIPEHTI